MLNLVLSHEAYFGLDFCFIYNLLELLSIIRHHTCHSVVVHNNKKNGPVTFLPSFATLKLEVTNIDSLFTYSEICDIQAKKERGGCEH